MIVGIGIDLTEVERIADLVRRWGDRFTHRIFTPHERAFAASRADGSTHLAARFAAKEAVLKALSVPRGLSWHEMEVLGGGQSRPEIALRGRARDAADRLGVARLHLTLTHTAQVAAAVVVAESDA